MDKRAAELQALLSAAATDVSAAEDLLASLQQRLRGEVVGGTTRVLERAESVKEAKEQKKLYWQQLACVMEQVGGAEWPSD